MFTSLSNPSNLAGLRLSALMCASVLVLSGRAEAQQPRLPRADASVTLGWLHADVSDVSEPYDRWANLRATLNGQAGVYWDEHWKTELAAERSNGEDRWQSAPVVLPGGAFVVRVSEHHIQDSRFSVGQFYQFGHNAWTHVLLGGGISLTLRQTLSDVQPLERYDRTGRIVVEPGWTESTNRVQASPFAAAAVKAYVTPRVFVRTDIHADFRAEIQAVILRVGFGVDF
jgi:hypothetical protein